MTLPKFALSCQLEKKKSREVGEACLKKRLPTKVSVVIWPTENSHGKSAEMSGLRIQNERQSVPRGAQSLGRDLQVGTPPSRE